MHFDKYQIPLSFDIMNSSEEMQTRRAAVRDPNNQRGLLTCAVKCISAINYYKLMWLSLPLVIGIIISWIHGMSTENICNPAKNNNLRNQETFAIFMLTGLIICLLLVCPTLPHLPDCWELSHLHPKWTHSQSLAAAALALMMKSFSSSAELWRQDTQPGSTMALAVATVHSLEVGLPRDPSATLAPAPHRKSQAGKENGIFATCGGGKEIINPRCMYICQALTLLQ